MQVPIEKVGEFNGVKKLADVLAKVESEHKKQSQPTILPITPPEATLKTLQGDEHEVISNKIVFDDSVLIINDSMISTSTMYGFTLY